MSNYNSISEINDQINEYNKKIMSCNNFLENMLKSDQLKSASVFLDESLKCVENVKVGNYGLEEDNITSLDQKIKDCINGLDNIRSLLNNRISQFKENIESLNERKRYLISLKNDMDGDSNESRTTND